MTVVVENNVEKVHLSVQSLRMSYDIDLINEPIRNGDPVLRDRQHAKSNAVAAGSRGVALTAVQPSYGRDVGIVEVGGVVHGIFQPAEF